MREGDVVPLVETTACDRMDVVHSRLEPHLGGFTWPRHGVSADVTDTVVALPQSLDGDALTGALPKRSEPLSGDVALVAPAVVTPPDLAVVRHKVAAVGAFTEEQRIVRVSILKHIEDGPLADERALERVVPFLWRKVQTVAPWAWLDQEEQHIVRGVRPGKS